MKTAGRIVLWVMGIACIHLCVFGMVWVVVCRIDGLFAGLLYARFPYTIQGWVFCYLPALLTGMMFGQLKESFRPAVTVPLGVIASWALFLGLGAFATWPHVYWTLDQNSVVPWPFNYWSLGDWFSSLFVLLSTGLAAQLGVEWFQPRQGAKWLLRLLVIFNVVVGLLAMRYFFLPHIVNDEVEHVHVAWVLSQGVIPYRDIHQPHPPLLWMLAWPIMNWLPRTAEAVLALRTLCAVALIGSYVAGLLMLREILGTIHRVPALVLLLLVLAVVPDFELWLFRPDPFMTLCSAWAILAVVCMRRAPARNSLLCGVALGLAASFSIRVSWLCFLVPLVSLWECWRQRTLRPLWLVIPNGAGFVLGILPVVLWLLYHGVFPSFWNWVIMANLGSVYNPFNAALLDSVFINRLLAASALLGGFWLLWGQWHAPKEAWAPTNGVLVGAVLAWLVPVTNPWHLVIPNIYYHYQLVMVPGAVLGTVFVTKLLAWSVRAWRLQLAMVALVFICIAAQKPALDLAWWALSKSQFRALNRLCAADNATCVAFAPWHPIFCRDATDLYLSVDFWNATNSFFSPVWRMNHQQLWPAAIAAIEQGRPGLMVEPVEFMPEHSEDSAMDVGIWSRAHRDRMINDGEYHRYQRAVRTLYERSHVEGMSVYTFKKDLRSRANP